ncbi:hypothetical protein SDC9_123193 [bioreactor metagenome]|uniref:Uncharacterized protein n=1 Tax=bioreactor metagenome TaxID=1076179 RepID=A0A645CGW7_9ZZZZ
MNKVRVPGETVQDVLHGADVIVGLIVGRTVRNFHRALGHGRAAEAAGLMEKGGGIVGAHVVAGLVPHQNLGFHHGALALTPIVNVGDHVLILEGALDGVDGPVHDQLVVHIQKRDGGLDQLVGQHGGGKRHPLIRTHIYGSPVRNDAVAGDCLDVLFVGVDQVLPLGAHGQRVKRQVTPVIFHIPGLHFPAYQYLSQINSFHRTSPFLFAPARPEKGRIGGRRRWLCVLFNKQ